jgi:predicted GH43/DUF377 family glycosyl hydrolase
VVAYVIERLDAVTLAPGSPVEGMDLLSPYVWRENGDYRMLFRGVASPLRRDEPTGVIAAAASSDGLNFTVEPQLAITPGSGPRADDAGGCEDPTVVIGQKGRYLVFYTGVDAAREQACLMVAKGESLDRLVKQQVVIKAPPGEGNIKEATLVRCERGGEWRLFYEYAKDRASRIGIAGGPNPDGPWEALPDPFTVREKLWDPWHLSTGPVVQLPGLDPVMFYNGATIDARWRIGWVTFDTSFSRVTARCLEPMLVPPPAALRTANDIAFAASTVIEDDLIALYFSIEDRELRRALIRAYR